MDQTAEEDFSELDSLKWKRELSLKIKLSAGKFTSTQFFIISSTILYQTILYANEHNTFFALHFKKAKCPQEL